MVRRTILGIAMVAAAVTARGQGPVVRYGDPVPRDVREMYDAGLRFLIKTQDDSGAWKDGQAGPGVTGMAVMALLASGEDPNHGPYRVPIRKALRSMIASQNAETGFLGSGQGHDSMYQHGFGMLALSEAYGTVDDRTLWTEAAASGQKGRPIGQSLELAVRCAVTSAKNNPHGAWRYSPDAKDADTSVSGAVPSPTCSPLNNIGASSFSPSPMTTMPSIGTVASTVRIASTAAPSAPFLSPRPTQREAASAADSVTRTSSIARLRSGFCEFGLISAHRTASHLRRPQGRDGADAHGYGVRGRTGRSLGTCRRSRVRSR